MSSSSDSEQQKPCKKPIVGVYGSRYQQGFIDDIGNLLDRLKKEGYEVFVETKLASLLNEEGYRLTVHGIRDCVTLPEHAEAVFSIGGDGTFLRTARWLAGKEIPIIGINTGHLGFLAENSIKDIEGVISLLNAEDRVVTRRMMLEVECGSLPAHAYPFALNEVAFLKADSASMISTRVDIDGYFLADYSADGLLVATPTGSTAYNLSVGGPILTPELNNIVLSPIAPHSLTVRPVVIGGESKIDATVSSRTGEFRLSIDGRSYRIPAGVSLSVKRSGRKVLTLHRRGENFAATLRNKLHWGI